MTESFKKSVIFQSRGNRQLALKTLSTCRESCRLHFAEHGHELGNEERLLFRNLGGAGDKVVDPFGHEHEICDLTKGYFGEGREILLASFFRHYALEVQRLTKYE